MALDEEARRLLVRTRRAHAVAKRGAERGVDRGALLAEAERLDGRLARAYRRLDLVTAWERRRLEELLGQVRTTRAAEPDIEAVPEWFRTDGWLGRGITQHGYRLVVALRARDVGTTAEARADVEAALRRTRGVLLIGDAGLTDFRRPDPAAAEV